MSPDFASAFEADLATIARAVDAPTGALGYGTDLSCVSDCTEFFEELDPSSPAGIAQRLARRFQTPRGTIDDDDYGLDLRSCVNRGMPQQELFALQQQAVNEAKKEETVDDAQVTLTLNVAEKTLRGEVRVLPKDPALSVFTTIFSVTSAEVLIDSISGAS